MIKTTIIGGELSSADIDSFKTDSEKEFEITFGKPSIFFQTGADAIAAALIIMNRREEISTLFVPEHFCHDTLLRVELKTKKEMSLKVVSYKSLSDLGPRKTGEVFFFVHFNVYRKEITDFIQSRPFEETFFFLEDFVQAPFSLKKRVAGFAFNCLRKGLARDIALTLGEYKQINFLKGETSLFHQALKKARELKALDLVLHEEEFLKLIESGKKLLYTPEVFLATESDVLNAKKLDWKRIKALREKNYLFLKNELSNVKELEVLPGESMYLMVKAENRDQLKSHLRAKQFFFPVHWLDANTSLSKNILSLVIDQRYGEEDMLRVAKAIKEFYGYIL